jgi:hypothetical protein
MVSPQSECCEPVMQTIAALYVATNGPYFGKAGVDPWDFDRDARRYAGPHPVVAHPPCQRWGKMWKGQPGNIKRGKVEKLGDDHGCFAAALDAVRRYGGVLEHPEHSHAWAHFNLNKPPRQGGWIAAELPGVDLGGWTCRVEQGRYGHYAAKPTWLYASGVVLPELNWGVSPPATQKDFPSSAIEKHGLAYCKRAGVMAFKGGGKDSAARIHTPPEFASLLIAMARSVQQHERTRPMRRQPRGASLD